MVQIFQINIGTNHLNQLRGYAPVIKGFSFFKILAVSISEGGRIREREKQSIPGRPSVQRL